MYTHQNDCFLGREGLKKEKGNYVKGIEGAENDKREKQPTLLRQLVALLQAPKLICASWQAEAYA